MKSKFDILYIVILYSFCLFNCKGQEKTDYFQKAKIEMANQNFEKAIELFTKSIDKKQEVAESFFARGLCYNLIKDYKNSVKDFTDSEKLGNDDVKLYTLRGFAYSELGENYLAFDDLNKAISINPDFYPKNYYNRGALEIRLKKAEEAIADFSIYIEKTDDPIAYCERGKVFSYLKKKDKACEDFEKAIELGYSDEEVLQLKNLNCKK